jgi:DNA-binding IclR family transcriptional regulator
MQNEFKETVLLGTLLGSKGVILEQIPGDQVFKLVIDPGVRLTLHTAAPCKAMIAFLPDQEKKKYLSKITYERFTENTIIDAEAFSSELKEIYRSGFSIDKSEEFLEVRCIAAPVFNYYNYPVAAVWITAPSYRIPEDRYEVLGKKVRMFADLISERIGK